LRYKLLQTVTRKFKPHPHYDSVSVIQGSVCALDSKLMTTDCTYKCMSLADTEAACCAWWLHAFRRWT